MPIHARCLQGYGKGNVPLLTLMRLRVGYAGAMFRFLVRLTLLAAVILLAALLFVSPWQSRSVTEQFNDQLLRIEASAAIQAGFIETMHEQQWESHAFMHVLGLTLPRGMTRARVRAPIKVYYGVRAESLHILGFEHGRLRLAVDKVEVLNVETDLSALELATKVGWARFDAISGEEARAAARKSFERSKYRAAGKLLVTADVSEHVRQAISDFAAAISDIKQVEIVRRDMEQPESGRQS